MNKLYILPLVNFVLLPGNVIGLVISDDKLVNYLSKNWQFIASLLKEEKSQKLNEIKLNEVGCLCEIVSIQKIYKNTYILQLKASKRVKMKKIEFEEIYPFTQSYYIIEDEKEVENGQLREIILEKAKRYVSIDDSFFEAIKNKNLCLLTDIIVSFMRIKAKIKQEFLEEIDCIKRAEKLIDVLDRILERWPGRVITLSSFKPKPIKTTIFLS